MPLATESAPVDKWSSRVDAPPRTSRTAGTVPAVISIFFKTWRAMHGRFRRSWWMSLGVGAGLASFLADQLGKGPRRVIVEPFVFTGKSKSDLGWAFVRLIDGGRIKEYADDGSDITRIYRHH